jgi:hypothetical protein
VGRQFSEKETQIVLKHMKRSTASLLIREMWFKISMGQLLYSDQEQKIDDPARAGEVCASNSLHPGQAGYNFQN